MPRKFKTPEVKDQNRESQRRSRARRKELVDDLKKNLEEYQRQGVTASLEMQMASRAVNHENQRLRSLLHMHGVSHGEIHHYLSSPESDFRPGQDRTKCKACGGTFLEPTLAQEALSNSQSHDISGSRPNAVENTSEAVFSTPTPATPVTLRRLDKNEHHEQMSPEERDLLDNHHDCSHMAGLYGSAAEHNTASLTDLLPPVSNCFCPPESAMPHMSHAETLETSCDAAAAILVELHGHTDSERARAALGCTGTNGCSVKNTKIFQLMDRFA